jgi:hypothetical protein
MGANIAIARRCFREVWWEGGDATVDALLARDIVGWMEECDVNSPEGFNRPVSFRGVTWLELRDGRIFRGWDSWHLGGLISSLTAVARREDLA